jgi:hypothetical protein
VSNSPQQLLVVRSCEKLKQTGAKAAGQRELWKSRSAHGAARAMGNRGARVGGAALPGDARPTEEDEGERMRREEDKPRACSAGCKPTLLQLFGLLQLQSIERKIL